MKLYKWYPKPKTELQREAQLRAIEIVNLIRQVKEVKIKNKLWLVFDYCNKIACGVL
jgi:hypothetical protein